MSSIVHCHQGYAEVNSIAETLIEQHSLDLKPDTEGYRLFCRELAWQVQKLSDGADLRSGADYFAMPSVSPVAQPKAKPVLLSEVIEKYYQEKRKLGSWSLKSEAEVVSALSQLVELVGDETVSLRNL